MIIILQGPDEKIAQCRNCTVKMLTHPNRVLEQIFAPRSSRKMSKWLLDPIRPELSPEAKIMKLRLLCVEQDKTRPAE